MTLVLVLGGRRSGKSAVAERLAAEPGEPVTYLAPLTVTDDEMAARVAAHRARRPAAWRTVETRNPAAALVEAGGTVLLDSLGTWVAEALWAGGLLDVAASPDAPHRLAALQAEVEAFADVAAARPGRTVVVAEEAGWGPVAPEAATRRWLDALGDAAQACARRASRAVLVVAGRELELP